MTQARKWNGPLQPGRTGTQDAPYRGGVPSVPLVCRDENPASSRPVPLVPLGLDSSDLLDLANRVRRLSPSHRDPEAFHVEKDAIAHSLRRLAMGGGHGQR